MMALGLTGFIVCSCVGAALWGCRLAVGAVSDCLCRRGAPCCGFRQRRAPAASLFASRNAQAETHAALSDCINFGLHGSAGAHFDGGPSSPRLTGPFLALRVGWWPLVLLAGWSERPQYGPRGRRAILQAVSVAGRSQDTPESETVAEPQGEAARLSWRDPRLRPWVFAGLIGGHAQAMVLGIAGFLVLDRLGLRDTPAEGAGPVGLVLMSGAIATLLAQWGLIPRFDLGPRAATLWGIAAAAVGTVILSVAGDLHLIALGYAIASLGVGLFRPGTTAGTSLAVTRAEQGQASGIVGRCGGELHLRPAWRWLNGIRLARLRPIVALARVRPRLA